MYQLKYDLIGKFGGDFRPHYKQPEYAYFIGRLERQLNKSNLYEVFSPHCQMTTNVTQMDKGKQLIITPWLTRTPPGVDGAMITKPGPAIALFNADCPVIILLDQNRGRLILLHASFRCLVPKNRKKPNIVSTAFKKFKLDPSVLKVFIGFGAGPCCYGANHYFEDIHRPETEPFIEITRKGPRKGQMSFNLISFARKQLRNHGVKESAVSTDERCTACAGRQDGGEGDFHSNIYDGKDCGRNLVLAWFEKK